MDANGKVQTEQFINMSHAKASEKVSDSEKAGNIVGHEVLESFFAGQNNPGASSSDAAAYNDAHDKAVSVDPLFDKDVNAYHDADTHTTGVLRIEQRGRRM